MERTLNLLARLAGLVLATIAISASGAGLIEQYEADPARFTQDLAACRQVIQESLGDYSLTGEAVQRCRRDYGTVKDSFPAVLPQVERCWKALEEAEADTMNAKAAYEATLRPYYHGVDREARWKTWAEAALARAQGCAATASGEIACGSELPLIASKDQSNNGFLPVETEYPKDALPNPKPRPKSDANRGFQPIEPENPGPAFPPTVGRSAPPSKPVPLPIPAPPGNTPPPANPTNNPPAVPLENPPFSSGGGSTPPEARSQAGQGNPDDWPSYQGRPYNPFPAKPFQPVTGGQPASGQPSIQPLFPNGGTLPDIPVGPGPPNYKKGRVGDVGEASSTGTPQTPKPSPCQPGKGLGGGASASGGRSVKLVARGKVGGWNISINVTAAPLDALTVANLDRPETSNSPWARAHGVLRKGGQYEVYELFDTRINTWTAFTPHVYLHVSRESQ